MNVGELKSLLARFDLTPSRKLGQSFLVDDIISQWIVGQLHPGPDDIVVEVGPGFGALTDHLAGKVKELILIEKDGRLAEFLTEKYAGLGVQVIHADATEFDVRSLFHQGPIKFIGNLPYSCGNEILRRFLDAPTVVSQAVVMVQKEVADRFVAVPRTKDYGVLSLMLQARWQPVALRTIGPEWFYPEPAVDSTIVRFDPRDIRTLAPHSPEVLAHSVKQGFSSRRKQLHNNLAQERTRWSEIVSALGIGENARAEELSLETWVELSNWLQPHPCASLPPSDEECLEVVDEQDVVVGVSPRREVHQTLVRHRAVHVLLLNREGELYLQKRSHFKDSHPGKWDSSASGHVDPGESYHDCAIREIWEETWVVPKGEVKRVLRLEASEETDQEFIEVFVAEPKGRIRVHGQEVDSGRFFTLSQIDQWIEARPDDFATGFITCYRLWRAQADPSPDRPNGDIEGTI